MAREDDGSSWEGRPDGVSGSEKRVASPQAPPKNRERGLVLLAKISVCAVSAVFVWNRGITFVHCQL